MDIVVVGLLLIIILILISVFAPEVLIYGLIVFCCVGLVIITIHFGAQFIHDPIGFLDNLIINNPIVVFVNTMPIMNQTVVP